MAMGILQALKLEAGPIDALAKLPQQQLIQMAQQRRIPADVLPVILNEKAEMAREVANAQAAAQGMQPSITERNIAINAQAEAQPSQPQMMAQAPMQGVANLPIPEDMYGSGESYAGGGIVAFAGEGRSDINLFDIVDQQQRQDPTLAGMFTPNTLAQSVEQAGALRAAVPQSPEVEAIKKYLADQERKNKEKYTDAWSRALEAGLGTLGGESPYGFVNIGRGSQAAAKGFAEDVKERRKQTLADMQLRLQLDNAARQEALSAIAAGERMYGEERTLRSREEQAEADRQARAAQAEADRQNRMAIAQIPDKTLQVAAQLRKNNPTMSYLDAVAQASQALTPRDTYNATRNAVSAAAKDANAEFLSRVSFDSKLQEDVRKAAQGDKDAQKRVDAIRNKIQQDTFRTYQVQGVDLSSGRMGPAAGAGGGGRGTVDTSNPLLQ